MWEPDGGASSGSSHQRGLILLVSALGFCFIVYKAWGPLLLITCTLVLVVHACYSLQVNDSLLAPSTLVLFRYIRELLVELALAVKLLAGLAYSRSKNCLDYVRQKYQERNTRLLREQQRQAAEEEMNGRQRSAYRLSTPGAELDEQVSPIIKNRYHSYALNGACNVARTSTPLPEGATWRKNVQQNGDLGLFMPINNSPLKKSQSQRSENRQPSVTLPRNEDTFYSPKGSPWGNSISPKIKDKSAGMKTVQTVAGPLLASTRYNIDPKVYSDVNSPGLTTRLTKYATEANSKLTHQPQYGTGQFPKVNLYANPVPLLSPKVARARMPVTVRVAPPEIVNYAPSDSLLHQEKSKSFSGSSPEPRESKSCPRFDQVLKEISLKRHASREDIMIELAKKQRTERVPEGQLENLEEMMQKRARDESMTSEDDSSPQSKTQRPLKRPKASSCHDILNSLSSSLSVFSGVKRKAMDTSRCSTPDIEKHFKPSSKSPNRSSSLTTQTAEPIKSKEQLNVKVAIAAATGEPHQHKEQEIAREPPKIDKTPPMKNQTDSPITTKPTIPKINQEITNFVPKTAKLTDKLFMRAEPQSNEKLKTLIEEQGEVEAKFTMDGKDEIKKQDIVNMRQNSMRLRLQSMFDAISGKSASKIDPDVVIQAEEVSPSASSAFTTLSSLTTTTTVNTSPITTTIVPILKTDTDNKSPITKHVTFNLPSTESSFSSTTSTLSSQDTIKPVISKPTMNTTSSFSGFTATTSSTPSFNLGSNAASTSSSTLFTTSKPPVQSTTTSGGFSFSTATTNSQKTEVKSSSSSSIAPSMFTQKSTSENLNTSNVISSSGFSFGAKTTPSTSSATTLASVISFPSMTAPAVAKITESSVPNSGFSFGNALAKSPATTSIAQTTTALSFGGDKKGTSGGFSFGASAPASTSTTTSSSQPASIFGTPVTSTPIFSAGTAAASSTTVAATSAVTKPAFSFGAGNATAAIATSKPSGSFSFGASTTNSAPTFGVPTPSVAPTATFASPAASSAAVTTATTTINRGFGTSNQSVFSAPQTGFSSSVQGPASSFKFSSATPSTTTASIFGSQSNTSAFGASVSTTTATTSLFGNTATPATAPSTIPSLFGNTAASPAATSSGTPTISAFGSSTTPQQQPGGIFSGVNTSTPASAPSIFGSTASTTAPIGLFSGGASVNPAASNMGATANPAESSNIFGQAKPPASLAFGATSSTFGTTNQPATFNAPSSSSGTSAFQLGGATPSSGGLPSFNSIKPSPQFGATTTPANTSGSIFGASSTGGFGSTPAAATSAFGAAPVANTGFGTSAPTNTGFGMQNSTAATQQPSAFGASPSGFGTSPATNSPFGAQTTTATPTHFGNTAPGATTSGGSFSFGGTQQQQQPQTQPQQQPSTSFSFGGSSGASTSGGGGIFQFGAASAPKPAGFNFNAPTGAPAINFTGSAPGAAPAFNAPPTNMFSIGSGSSTPRSRTSRQRRQR